MSKIQCGNCGKEYSAKGEQCPDCGEPARSSLGDFAGTIGCGCVALFFVISALLMGVDELAQWGQTNAVAGWIFVVVAVGVAGFAASQGIESGALRLLGFAGLLVAVLLLYWPDGGLDPAGNSESHGPMEAVITETVNMRQGPGIDYSVVRVLNVGDTVEIERDSAITPWVAVLAGSGMRNGYVHGEYVERVER